MFERSPLGGHSNPKFNDRPKNHQYRGDQISDEQRISRTSTYDPSEENWRADSAGQSPDRVENCDRERANFERKNFAYRQIGRTRSRRSDKENNRPRQRLCLRSQQSRVKEPAGQREQDSGKSIGRRDHLLAANRVEEVSEQQRAKEVSDRKWEEITSCPVSRHAIEAHQYQRVSEKDGVVKKSLGRHQDEAEKRAL